MKRLLPALTAFLLSSVFHLARAQDQIAPTVINDQNRTGPLPFSTTFGGSVDHVDVSSGNVSLNIPLFHAKSRGLDFDIALRYETNFYSPAMLSGLNELWTVQKRNYFYGSLGWEINEPYLMYNRTNEHVACLTDTLPPVNSGVPTPATDGIINAYSNFIYVDVNGGQHVFDAETVVADCPDVGAVGFQSPGPSMDASGYWLPSGPSDALSLNQSPILDAGGNIHTSGSTDPTATIASNLLSISRTLPGVIDTDNNADVVNLSGNDTLDRALISQSRSENLVVLSYNDVSGQQQTITIQLEQIHYGTNFAVTSYYGGVIYDIDQSSNGPTANAISSITLPNGQSYVFSYSANGYLSSLKLPTGAVVQYQYSNYFSQDDSRTYVSQRTETVGSQVNTTNFALSCALFEYGGCQQFTSNLTGPDGRLRQYLSTGGMLLQAKEFDGGTASATSRRQFDLCYYGQSGQLCSAAVTGTDPTRLPTSVIETLDGIISARTDYDYDSFTYPEDNFDVGGCSSPGALADCIQSDLGMQPARGSRGNVVAIRHYDWAPAGQTGTLLQQNVKTYLHDANPNYVTDTNAIVHNIVSKVQTDTVYGGDAVCHPNQPCSAPMLLQTTYGYDEDGAGYRGRVTSVSKWVNLPAPHTDVVQYRYDTYGNITWMQDAGGNQTTWGYADNWQTPGGACAPPAGSSAFATSKTNALQQTTTASYYACTGQVAAIADPNDAANGRPGTRFLYDLMSRLTDTYAPDGGHKQSIYDDIQNTIESRVYRTGASYTAALTREDSLGRTTQVQNTTDPWGAVSVDTAYDSMGRVFSVSNPYRSGDPLVATYTTYDALGRKLLQTNPDSTTVSATYLGNATTYTDEAGKQWQRSTDGLGRLTQVLEPDSVSGLPSLSTTYRYDGLGNLLQVVQTGKAGETPRTRSFAYDSLSRLLTSTNPETGTLCYGLWNGSSCTGGYDANGNLLYKTDANGMTITYTYDALNRLLTKVAPDSYPMSHFIYDQGANGIGRLGLEYVDGVAGTTYAYDPMGRVTGTTWYDYDHGTWTSGMGAQYDLAGNVTQLTYPDGRVVSQSFDGAGRLSGVYDGPLNGGGQAYFSGAQYWPSGALQSATYGNQVSEGISLNSRLQPCHTVASTPLLPANSGGGNLYDRASFYSGGALGPESNCGSATGNNGNIYSIVDNRVAGWTQSFGYDSLNRLTTAARSDGGYNHTYKYDSFGNMLPVDNLHTPMNYGIDAATNRMELNGDLTTGDLRYYANGQLAQAPNGLGGSHSFVYTAEGYLRCIDGCGLGSYLYNGGGDRTLAVRNSTTWNEYAYLNGQPMADVDNTGTWTDYIYANGQKIAKVASQVPLFHLSGLRDSSINMGWGVEGPILGGYGAGTIIVAGDQLTYDFRQTIPSYGGLALIFDNGTVGAGDLVDTATGTPTWNDGTADGLWHHRAAKLDEYVGHSLTYAYAGLHNTMPAGWFDMYYANIVILHADGSVTPIYTGQSGVSVPGFLGWNGGCRSCYSGTDLTPTTDLAVNANYYLNDHLGTTQVELSAGGVPLWQGQFTPFGQEIVNGQTDNLIGQQPADGTSMRFKFTGKERDTESGLDYFGARYYASSMGRWMSPDWAAKAEPVPYSVLDDPQSLNLYSYVRNNPLSHDDPDGHDCPTCQKVWNWLTSSHSSSASASATAGQGSASNGSFSAGAKALTASASASASYGANTSVGAKASASVAEATVNEGTHSTTQMNGLTANANANAGVGLSPKTGIGVSAGAGANADVLTASQTEKITIGPVTITGTATGAVGIGANASASLGTNGVSASAGVTPGVGGGLSLSITWNGVSATGGVKSQSDMNGTKNTVKQPEIRPQQ